MLKQSSNHSGPTAYLSYHTLALIFNFIVLVSAISSSVQGVIIVSSITRTSYLDQELEDKTTYSYVLEVEPPKQKTRLRQGGSLPITLLNRVKQCLKPLVEVRPQPATFGG